MQRIARSARYASGADGASIDPAPTDVETIATEQLLARVFAGEVGDDLVVWREASASWQPAREWYIEQSRIRAPDDTEDDRYLAAHRAGALDPDALAGLLGVSLAAYELELHVSGGEGVAGRGVRLEGASAIDLAAAEQAIVMPEQGSAAAGQGDVIGVPSWGRHWQLPVSAAIEVPQWQDPATAMPVLPVWDPPQWARMPRSRPATEAEIAESRRRDEARAVLDRADRSGESNEARLDRSRGEGARRSASVAAEREAAADVEAAADDGATSEDEVAARRAARRAQRRARRDAAAREQAAAATEVVAEAPTAADEVRAAAAAAGIDAADDARRVQTRSGGLDRGLLTDEQARDAKGGSAVVSHTGCLGCLGHLVLLGVLAFAVALGVDVGLQRFVASDLARELAPTKASSALQRAPSQVDGLVAIGPRDSVLPVVVAFNPMTREGVALLRDVLAWRRDAGTTQRFADGSGPRLVLLPLEAGDNGDSVEALLTLHFSGALLAGVEQGESLLDALVAGEPRPMRLQRLREAWRSHGHGAAELDALLAPGGAGDDARTARDARVAKARLAARRIAETFDLAAPGGVAVAARGVAAADLAGGSGTYQAARVREALDVAAAAAVHEFSGVTYAEGWRRALRAVDPLRALRWRTWIVDGERLGQDVEADAAAAPSAREVARLAVPPSAHRAGNPAGVQLVMVGDPACPHCRVLWRRLLRARRDHPDDVELVLVLRPNEKLYPGADEAAALIAAAEGAHAFDIADQLFRYGARPALRRSMLRRLGRRLPGLDVAALEAAADGPAAAAALAEQRAWADERGVDGTPVLFVDGVSVRGAISRADLYARIAKAKALRAAASRPAGADASDAPAAATASDRAP